MTAITTRAGAAAALLSLLSAPALAQAPGMDSAVIDDSCDRDCLLGFVDAYMAALAAQRPGDAPLADDVVFTENNVVLAPGDGLWRTIDGVSEKAMRAADPETGNAARFGVVTEQGNPAFYTMRIKVEDQEITEVETVVVRLPDGPKPFGDPDADHDPEWDQVLPEEQRLPRERLMAIADGYFDTVELNNGQTFTEFAADCGRLENGISTTAAGNGFGAAATTPGCEAQFRLGMYRINKRIRERRYPLIDTERGVVVSTGFFDHNNWFDEYLLNDGRTMRTALKWPNSITLIEAFRIKPGPLNPIPGNDDPEAGWRDGEIQRIEATFTYVPYSMHNPFTGPAADIGELPPVADGAPCDEACLTAVAESYIAGMLEQDPSGVPWADKVHFSENGVKWMIGDAIWGTASAVTGEPLVLTDPESGQLIWFSVVEEHGQPGYFAMSMSVRDGKVAAVDTLASRREHPGTWAEPGPYSFDPIFSTVLPEDSRTRPGLMRAIAGEFLTSPVSGAGSVELEFDPECRIVTNGQVQAGEDGEDASCEALKTGPGGFIESIRGYEDQTSLVDEARGVVVQFTMADLPFGGAEQRVTDGEPTVQEVPYPYTRGQANLIKIVDGKIAWVERVSTFLPYRMPVP